MAETSADLEILIVTPHGAPVSGADVQVIGAGVDCPVTEDGSGLYKTVLPAPGDYYLLVERHDKPDGFDHRTLRAPLFHVGDGLLSLRPSGGERSSVEEVSTGDDRHRVRVTLDYLWFTPVGYPPTLGNRVEVLADGEAGWGAVAVAARQARRSLRLTTWLYQGSTTLERPLPISDPPERAPHTVQRLLESLATAGVKVQVLLWDAPIVGRPEELELEEGHAIEVLEEQNPTRRPLFEGPGARVYNKLAGSFEVGSYHQKTVVVDGRIGFCGGMNLKENDWDTRHHHLFDPRRCAFSRPAAFLRRVDERRTPSDYPPRHDFIARVEGPAVTHLEENFRQRWNHLIGRRSAQPGGVSPVEPPEPIAPGAGASQVQVVRTMPEPFSERGILDVYLRAIGTARRLIYIEDQYFRSIRVSDAIADAARAWPELEVIVVTQERMANQVLLGGWSYECFERIARRRPGFELYTLRVSEEDARGERELTEVDVHAKLMIVDDVFLTVGSCNVNDRGFEYEGEINLAVVDPALVRSFRADLFREHLGGDARVTGDIRADAAAWREHAEQNRSLDPKGGVAPASQVFPFAPRPRRKPVWSSDLF